MNRRSFLLSQVSTWLKVIFGLVVVAILLAIVGFLIGSKVIPLQTGSLPQRSLQAPGFQQNGSTPEPSVYLPLISNPPQTDKSVQSATWKTHIDSTFGFSIQYPASWKIYTEPTVGLGYSFQSPDLQTGYGGAIQSGTYLRLSWLTVSQDLEASSSSTLSIQDWLAGNLEAGSEVKILSEPTAIVHAAGVDSLQVDREIFLRGKTRTTALVVDNGLLLFDCFSADQVWKTAIPICEHMIRSFRFVP